MSKQPIRASFASILAARTELQVVSRTEDTSRVQVRDARNNKVLDPRLGVAMLRAAGVAGAVRANENTLVVADAALRRLTMEQEIALLTALARRISVKLHRLDADATQPVAYVVGNRIFVNRDEITEELASLKEAQAYLDWLIATGLVAMPSEWRAHRN